jgi:hypothetical protein
MIRKLEIGMSDSKVIAQAQAAQADSDDFGCINDITSVSVPVNVILHYHDRLF